MNIIATPERLARRVRHYVRTRILPAQQCEVDDVSTDGRHPSRLPGLGCSTRSLHRHQVAYLQVRHIAESGAAHRGVRDRRPVARARIRAAEKDVVELRFDVVIEYVKGTRAYR